MRKLLGLVLAMFGVAFGVAAFQNAPTHREDQLAAVTRILTNPGVDAWTPRPPDAIAPATAKPVTPLPTSIAPPITSQTGVVKLAAATATPVAANGPVPPGPTAEVASVSKTGVLNAGVANETGIGERPGATSVWQASVTSQAVLPSVAPPSEGRERLDLVRSLQTELKRVGCYSGDADGNWGSGSRRALATFMERVNASLPVERPDHIQLTLLQGQSAAVCGRDCPKGQALAGDGRCVPSAILARAGSKKSANETQVADWTAQTKVRSENSPDVSAAAVEVSQAERLPWADKPVEQAPVAQASFAPDPAPAPAQSTDRAATLASDVATASVEKYETASVTKSTANSTANSSERIVLPGRMSVGGPVPPPTASPDALNPKPGPQLASEPERLARLESCDDTDDAPLATDDAAQDNAVADEANDRANEASTESTETVDEALQQSRYDRRPVNRASAAKRTPAANQRIAAVAAAPQHIAAPPRFVAPPRIRVAVPRSYSPPPRVRKAQARPGRQRSYAGFRPRSVQNLFTHPLGRM